MKKGTKKQKKFKKLRIVSSNYEITYHKELKDENGVNDGSASETKKEIKVLDGMLYQRTLQVIMHESMHVLQWELCIRKNKEEKTNILLTTGVTCFIRDNPEFIMEYMRVLNGS